MPYKRTESGTSRLLRPAIPSHSVLSAATSCARCCSAERQCSRRSSHCNGLIAIRVVAWASHEGIRGLRSDCVCSTCLNSGWRG